MLNFGAAVLLKYVCHTDSLPQQGLSHCAGPSPTFSPAGVTGIPLFSELIIFISKSELPAWFLLLCALKDEYPLVL